MKIRGEMGKFVRRMQREGWTASNTNGGHVRFEHPDAKTPVFGPSTPSSKRSLHHLLADMKRALRPDEPPATETAVAICAPELLRGAAKPPRFAAATPRPGRCPPADVDVPDQVSDLRPPEELDVPARDENAAAGTSSTPMSSSAPAITGTRPADPSGPHPSEAHAPDAAKAAPLLEPTRSDRAASFPSPDRCSRGAVMPTDLKILSGEIGGLALRLLRGELAAIEVRPDMVGGVLVFDGRGFALLRDAEAGPTAALSEAPRPRPEILSEKLRERRHVVMEIFRALPEERLTLGQIAEMPECAAFAATYPARKSAIHRVAEGLVREGLLVVETDRVSRNPLDRPTRYYKLA